jgi:predicted RNA-binding Zn ribbon-like protein
MDFEGVVAPWETGHFIGGHIALDLANTVFHRREPMPDNELLKSVRDVSSWCQSAGLISPSDARTLNSHADDELVTAVHRVRDHVWAAFDAVSVGDAPPAKAMGSLLRQASRGTSAEIVSFTDARMTKLAGNFGDPDAVASALAVLAVEALFVLPTDRVRSCPRCGWLFVDGSKGGRRRWCSMSTCGNREKANRRRHGEQTPVATTAFA